jgi:hypothetical protein
MTDDTWRSIEIVPYGATLYVPAHWEALPPVPANGPEILRATGGPGKNLIVFKIPARGMSADQVADQAQTRLEAHGYDGFARRAVTFAGQDGVSLDFAVRGGAGTVIQQTRNYYAVRGQAGYVLGMGSQTWAEHEPLIEEIARRFALE